MRADNWTALWFYYVVSEKSCKNRKKYILLLMLTVNLFSSSIFKRRWRLEYEIWAVRVGRGSGPCPSFCSAVVPKQNG